MTSFASYIDVQQEGQLFAESTLFFYLLLLELQDESFLRCEARKQWTKRPIPFRQLQHGIQDAERECKKAQLPTVALRESNEVAFLEDRCFSIGIAIEYLLVTSKMICAHLVVMIIVKVIGPKRYEVQGLSHQMFSQPKLTVIFECRDNMHTLIV
jgi:hypothetical protein